MLTVHRVASHRLAAHDAGIRGAVGYLAAATPTVRHLLAQQPYDVVHFVFSLPTAAMLPLLDLHGAPVIVTLRGSDVPGYDERQRGLRQVHRLLHPLTRWIWHRAERVLVPSESLGRLARRTDARLRYSVVPGGVDLSSFRPRTALRRLPDGVVRCLAVARLVERNGLDDLLDALALLERGRYQLEIVGTGPYEAALRERVRRLGLEAGVRFTGWLEHREVARRCREADLFTLAPWVESFGNAFVEALASGLPIVGEHGRRHSRAGGARAKRHAGAAAAPARAGPRHLLSGRRPAPPRRAEPPEPGRRRADLCVGPDDGTASRPVSGGAAPRGLPPAAGGDSLEQLVRAADGSPPTSGHG